MLKKVNNPHERNANVLGGSCVEWRCLRLCDESDQHVSLVGVARPERNNLARSTQHRQVAAVPLGRLDPRTRQAHAAKLMLVAQRVDEIAIREYYRPLPP